jgi:hypothetical protein
MAVPAQTENPEVVYRHAGGGSRFAYEQAEAGNHESEAHERQAGTDPGQEGAFGGEVNTEISFWFGRGVSFSRISLRGGFGESGVIIFA